MDHFEIRAGTTEHFADVCELAQHLNTVNLPDNPTAIRELLQTSERSFSGALRDARQREYLFVLWDERRGRVLGTSMIIAQLGRRGVPYIYLEVGTEEKYSATLDLHLAHRVLTTRYSYDGPTEIGGLVMHPDSRRSPEKLGSLISYVRFLFIAMHRTDFRDEVLAELLPPFEDDGTSPLWEAYGRRFTGLTYREADQLSKSNKEFVRSLFPDEIYATPLPEAAQRAIGEVGPQTKGVEKLLRRVGFEYAERVDPFDGGPHFTCPTDEITLVRGARPWQLSAATPEALAAGGVRGILARSYAHPPYFRALPAVGIPSQPPPRAPATDLRPSEGGNDLPTLGVSASVVEKIAAGDRETVFWTPLP